MRVALVYNAVLPALQYGGTERVVCWLAKGLAESGHTPILVGRPGSTNPWGPVHFSTFESGWMHVLPPVDVVHFFNTPDENPAYPYLVTIGGNAKPGERFLPHTVFVSADHARRHGSTEFVYNGIDLSEYRIEPRKEERAVFLGKASWRVKNIRGAVRIARSAGLPLDVLGGSRPWWSLIDRNRWHGMVGQDRKREVLGRARALIFPVIWDEPFGLAIIEALASGCAVFGSPRGSLPELVPSEVGRLDASEPVLVEALRTVRPDPEACRSWAMRFSHQEMTANYLKKYSQVVP